MAQRKSRSPIGRVTQPRPVACDKCGTPHERCIGHKTIDGERRPCKAWPVKGAEVCMAHGGAAPQVREKAAERIAEDKARRDVARFGGSLAVDPSVALLQEVHRSAATVAYLQDRVNELESEDLIEVGAFGARSPNVWIQLYQQERDRLARVSKAAIDAGCAQSMVEVFQQVASTYVQLVGRVLDRVVGELALPEGERDRVAGLTQAAFEAELSLVEGGNVA